MIAALIATAMTVPAPAATIAQPEHSNARPALFVVNDEDTIVYLFGTFHALDGKSEWFNDEVRTAFSGSKELVLETLVPDSLRRPVVRPRGTIQPVGPYAGSAAEQAGKPVDGLESFEFQMNMFAKMPGAKPPAGREAAERTKAQVAAVLERLQGDWNRGDIEGFTPMLQQMEASSPQTYKLLFKDRNSRWAHWIARRLQQPGVVFVSVGAGHLAGKDSVQQKLSLYGIRTARVN